MMQTIEDCERQIEELKVKCRQQPTRKKKHEVAFEIGRVLLQLGKLEAAEKARKAL
jgi:hypothetical protein